jgi:hypothetical protein
VAAALLEHRGDRAPGGLEEAAQVHAVDQGEVVVGVLGERLRDEQAGVVDQGVDPAEGVQALLDHPGPGAGLRDVTRDRQDPRVVGALDGARVRDDRVTELAVRRDEPGADALRRAGDHGDFLGSHGSPCLEGLYFDGCRTIRGFPRPVSSLLRGSAY